MNFFLHFDFLNLKLLFFWTFFLDFLKNFLNEGDFSVLIFYDKVYRKQISTIWKCPDVTIISLILWNLGWSRDNFIMDWKPRKFPNAGLVHHVREKNSKCDGVTHFDPGLQALHDD